MFISRPFASCDWLSASAIAMMTFDGYWLITSWVVRS